MLFTEPIFFVFYFAVFWGYWLLPSHDARKLMLLAASHIFYAAWDWRFCGLIAVSTAIDYVAGRQLGLLPDGHRRRVWLVLSLVANLGILGFFKYFNFFVESASSLFGLEADRTLNIVLPVGISFFTFQSMSYTIDVYRRQLNAITSATDFALYVSFFPQLVAGPIVRASHFLPQLATKKRFGDIAFQSALTLFLIGFVKKACISDNIATLIDPVFAAPEGYTAASIWMATTFYAVQIYCDFSGYTDMAIAIAAMLGFQLNLNFNFPYFARSVTEFWQRWHISLSTWLRDYLYIPLGGNRHGALNTYRNLMITMLLGGLWHGAAWTFVIWGGLHGLALAVNRWFSKRWTVSGVIGPIFCWAATLYWVCLTWIFFRALSLEDAVLMVRAFLTFQSPGGTSLNLELLFWLIPLGIAHYMAKTWDVPALAMRLPERAYAAALGVAVIVALMFVPQESRPFIYFQF